MREYTVRLSAFLFVFAAGVVLISSASFLSSDQVAADADNLFDHPPIFSGGMPTMRGLNIRDGKIENLNSEIEQQIEFTSASFHGEDGGQSIFLRTEIGQHNGSVHGADLDPKSSTFITIGGDNTVRFWDIAPEEEKKVHLNTTWRLPFASGEEKKLTAVDASDDGRLIVVAALSEVRDSVTSDFYVLRRMDGKILFRTEVGSKRIYSIKFTPRENHIIAESDWGELKIWRTEDEESWAEIESLDLRGNSQVYDINFNKNREMFVTTRSGSLLKYDRRLEFERSSQPVTNYPSEVVSSPDGKYVAVTDAARAELKVLKSDTLEESEIVFSNSGLNLRSNYTIDFLDWGADGYICAGNSARNRPNFRDSVVIRCINPEANDIHTVAVTDANLFSIRALKDGNFVFADGTGGIGVINPEKRELSQYKSRTIDLNYYNQEHWGGLTNQFKISNDAAILAWPNEKDRSSSGANPSYFTFDLRMRELVETRQEPDGLAKPIVSGAMFIRHNNGFDPWLLRSGGTEVRLPISGGETVQSYAVASDGKALVVGTNLRLIKFDDQGKIIWEKLTADSAMRLNLSSDGQFVVAGMYAEGVFVWRRLSDGEKILTLLPLANEDPKKWVMWTPSGYYDASAGAEDLIGWHVDRGADELASFFPISRFREAYYRPDKIQEALEAAAISEPPTRDDLLELAPPIVSITSSEQSRDGTVRVEYFVDAFFESPVDIDVFVDGARYELTDDRRNIEPGESGSFVVKAYSANADIAVVAVGDGKRSAPDGAKARGAVSLVIDEENLPKPRLFAVIAGVSEYLNSSDELRNLNFAHQDALDFGGFLDAQRGQGLFDEVYVSILPDDDASRANITSALEKLLPGEDSDSMPKPTARDTTLFFYAGHGLKDTGTSKLYLMPYDADETNLEETAIDSLYLQETMRGILGKKFVYLDACYSGFGSTETLGLFDTFTTVNTVGTSDGFVEVLASSGPKQLSWEHPDWSNGAFTQSLMEIVGAEVQTSLDAETKLKIEAAVFDGRLSNSEIIDYSQFRVQKLVEEKINVAQTPVYKSTGSRQSNILEITE